MSYFVIKSETDPYTIARLREDWRCWNMYGGMRNSPQANACSPFEFDLEDTEYDHTVDDVYSFDSAGFVDTCCLFSDELLELLYRVGVDNLEVFPAILYMPEGATPKFLKNYKAVNILGNLSCLDKKQSKFVDLGDGTGLVQGGVDSMCIDESKTDGLLMFRPIPGIGAVLVHERVKNAIEAAELPGLYFDDPSEWAGF